MCFRANAFSCISWIAGSCISWLAFVCSAGDQRAGKAPRRELPSRIDRALDGAHFVDPFRAVQLAEQLLLHRVPADAVLGERRSAEPDHLAAERQDRGLARLDVGHRSRDDVRVQVAVGDVSPHGVQAAPRELLVVERQQLREPVERDDHVRRGLVDSRVDGVRAAHALVHGGRHRFAQQPQLVGAPPIPRYRDLDVVQHGSLGERAAEPHDRRVGRVRIARESDLRKGVFGARVRTQFERHEERHDRVGGPGDAGGGIDAVLAQQLQAPLIHVLDGRDVEAARAAVLHASGA